MKRRIACNYQFKRSWWCSRQLAHGGPCALRPRWWNLPVWVRLYRGTW